MLEVRDLKKIYKTKKAAAVHALDGVSLQFPETGMVFLLGKSGSGKSTLLNVCGGLDSPTSGEVIVKGRSSKDFSQSDFDSYRNTFIGFIFQEYNILNEFTVEDNIALALELQGKPKDKAAINALLEEVDLVGYAKRKPNTLSGGQKQRIAIARALVKKPEIIMADEPTGALDSFTGKQVFDTLKKLSKTKLVIVVSHDRDFAEQYGDRIIELKDGLVLSDETKTHAENEAVSDNMSVIGDVLCIKKGTELTEHDFGRIKDFLKKSDTDVVIATDKKSVKTFKTAARITDEGQMEVFRETAADGIAKRQYTKEESRFIRSKLPLRHAFKIGVSGLKSKPIRLFFTILLCTVAFVLFGMLSTLNFYDSEATFRQTMRDTDISSIRLSKQYKEIITWYQYGEEQDSYETWNSGRFSPEEVEALADKLNSNAFGGIEYGGSFNLRQVTSPYWQNYIRAFAALPEGNNLRDRMSGEYPRETGEIALSSYLADMLVACNVYDNNGNALELESTDELIGKTVAISGREFKITGIVDSGSIPREFDGLKENGGQNDYSLQYKLMSALESGLHLLAFVSDDQLATVSQEYRPYKEGRDNYMQIAAGFKYDGEYQIPEYSDNLYNGISALPAGQKIYALSGEFTTLADDEILIPASRFFSYLGDMFSRLAEQARENENYELSDEYSTLCSMAWELQSGGIWEYPENSKDKDEMQEPIFHPFDDEKYEEGLLKLLKAAQDANVDMTIGMRLFDNYNQASIGDVQVYRIAGLYQASSEYYYQTLYVTDAQADALWEQQRTSIMDYSESETNYVEAPNAIYSAVYLPGNVSESKIDAYWEIYSNKDFDENSSRIAMSGSFVDSLQMVDNLVESLSQVFLYVGLVLAVFAALLLSNFISVSISNKKREIGILRAVGARSFDVFKIFFSESFVIGVICVLFSCGVSSWLCTMINQEYSADLGASVFVFGIPSIAVLMAIAAVTLVVATFLPVYNAAKKKPVESIRTL